MEMKISDTGWLCAKDPRTGQMVPLTRLTLQQTLDVRRNIPPKVKPYNPDVVKTHGIGYLCG